MFEWDPVLASGRKMVGLDPAAGSDEDLFEAATALERLRRSVDGAQVQVLAELRRREACDVEFGLSTGAWIAREAGLPVIACKKRAAVAEKLHRTLTVTLDALAEGRIGWDHARVLADACNPRIEHEFVELQESLIDLAQGMVFERWRAEVLGIAAQLDQDGGYDPNEDPTNNTLRLSSTLDGLGVLNGTLTAENMVITEQALNAIADELYRQYARDHEICSEIPVPSRKELMALALVEVIRRALGVDLASTKAPRPEVNLVAPASDPEHGVATGDGVRLADGSVRTLLCAAAWFPMVVDSLGNPLAMGTATRYATAAQRRFIRLRDGGCVFPGCEKPHSWCDAHHVEHHEHGGPTEVANLASLCRHHHGITHTTGWKMHTTADGWFWWQSPAGRTFWSQRDGRQREGPPPDPIDPPPWPPPPRHRKRRRRRPVRSRD